MATRTRRRRKPTRAQAEASALRSRLRKEARVTAQEEIAGRPKPKKCEICTEEQPLVFDHCHGKGHFRGWLCHRCNRVLGQVKDNVTTLSNMTKYLSRWA